MTDAGEAVARLIGARPISLSPLGGAAWVAELEGGRQVVAKSSELPGAGRAEAASLRWLAEPGTVAIPTVHAHDDRWLVTELVPPGQPGREAARNLGRDLARMHAAGAPAYGSAPPGGLAHATIGLAPMSNVECGSWPEFYFRWRVGPYVEKAVARGSLAAGEARIFDEVGGELEHLAGPPEPPARLHGDLWSGNVLWGGDGRAWLIDPAAHGGHRETDLAMLALFGCPHLEDVLEAYDDEWPLAPGWRDRVALHQLFPLLVHAVLFGGGYARQAVSAARRALRAGGR